MSTEPAPEEPCYKLRWLITMPRIDPPIARDCMIAPVPWPERLGRQIIPHTRIRDCCWHHSIDWRQASAAAVTLARQMIRDHITGDEEMFDRAFTLIHALELPERQQQAVEALLYPGDGIEIEIRPGHRWRRRYMNGRKRAHAMLESGVRRTVVVCWRAPRRTPPTEG